MGVGHAGGRHVWYKSTTIRLLELEHIGPQQVRKHSEERGCWQLAWGREGSPRGLALFQVRRRKEGRGKRAGLLGHLKETKRGETTRMARPNTLVPEFDKNAGLGRDC